MSTDIPDDIVWIVDEETLTARPLLSMRPQPGDDAGAAESHSAKSGDDE